MFWALVPDYGIIEEEQFLRPLFELVSCKPILFNSGFEGEWERRRGTEEPGKKWGCYTVRGGNKVWLPPPFSVERNFWRAILCASCCWADVSCITVTPAGVAEHWFLYMELRRKKKKPIFYKTKKSAGGGAAAILAPSGFEHVHVGVYVCVFFKWGADIPWLFSENIRKSTSRVKGG